MEGDKGIYERVETQMSKVQYHSDTISWQFTADLLGFGGRRPDWSVSRRVIGQFARVSVVGGR